MPNESILNAFPSNVTEALAYLYVERQDLSGKSPADIYEMYQEAMHEIRMEKKRMTNSGWFRKKREELQQL